MVSADFSDCWPKRRALRKIEMRKASIIRNKTGDSGTFGCLTLDDGWSCHTGELPRRDNPSD